MHKTNSIFEAAKTVLQTEAVTYKEDGKFEITPKIQTILDDLSDQITARIDTERQIDDLMKEIEKISKKYQAIEVKYWKEVDKFGFNPRTVAAPAHTALNKVASRKK